MCILCNVPENVHLAGTFLSSFSQSQGKMKEATQLMLEVSKSAALEKDRKRYGDIHKKMRKLQRAWNRLEHQREEAS